MNYEINDFIGVFDNFMPEDYIDAYLNQFTECEKQGLTYSRTDGSHHQKHSVDDNALDICDFPFYNSSFNLQSTSKFFREVFFHEVYPLYTNKYSILNTLAPHAFFGLKIQKTLPGQGYHVWHPEICNGSTRSRMLAVMMYLNDVEQGGETEFLYQAQRVQPKRNRIVVWPASFTHTHRGNPPLSGEKYILTGWIEWAEA